MSFQLREWKVIHRGNPFLSQRSGVGFLIEISHAAFSSEVAGDAILL